MAKQARHSEWAKFKLIGRPVITGTALGSSSLLWVACRTSPHLVRVYEDANLRALLRFPDDPVFLLFGPPQEDDDSLWSKKSLKCQPLCASLLVITLDGCVWRIPLVDSCILGNRSVKRLKLDFSGEIEKAGSKGVSLSSKSLGVSDYWRSQEKDVDDEWHLFQESEIYKDTDFYSPNCYDAELEVPSCSTEIINLCQKPLRLHTPQDTSQKLRAKCVRPEALIGKVPGAFLAAFGPENLIAIVSASSSPIFLKGNLLSSSSALAQDPYSSDNGGAVKCAKPTCLLFSTTLDGLNNRLWWGGASLSQRFFDALVRKFESIKPKHLLLQGNNVGQVHIFPVEYPNQTCTSTVFCDLQEPISGLSAAPSHNESDVLLIISHYGRVVAITVTEQESISSPFVNAPTGPQFARLFQVDLKDGFIIHEWKVREPVFSPTMSGSKHLCFCSSSNVCIADLFGNLAGEASYKNYRNLVPTKLSGELLGMALEQYLICKCVNVADVVIAIVGKGPFVPAISTGALVALTSRGRLLSLEVSENVLKTEIDGYMTRQYCKSWKSGLQKREDLVTELLHNIATVERHTEALQVKKNYLNLAISEMASALRFASDVLSTKHRQEVWSPHLSLATRNLNGLQCNLEVTPVVSSISTERLRFGHCSDFQQFKSFLSFADLGLCLKVSLFNGSSCPISPYWSLVLRLSNPDATHSNKSMSFSSIINDGYGLAAGAKCTIDVHIEHTGNCLSPLVASVFLCHTHENHDEIVKTPSSSTVKDRNERLETETNVSKKVKDFMQAFHNGQDGATVLGISPGAVCLLLAKYRIDILSFLSAPRKLQYPSYIRPPMTSYLSNLVVDSAHAGDDLLGPFLGKFQLKSPREGATSVWDGLSVVQKWQESLLEDLIEHTNPSKNGDQLTASDPNGGTVSLSLDNNVTGRNGLLSREIQISASPFLLGCSIRESILWRLSKRKKHWPINSEGKPEHYQRGSPKHGGIEVVDSVHQMISFVIETEKKMDAVLRDIEAISNIGRRIGSEPSEQILERACKVIMSLAEIYRTYRENAVSDPFIML